MKKVLLTGFGSFKGFSINPSMVITEALEVEGVDLRKMVFQVNQLDIQDRYPTLLDEFQPNIIINLGLHASVGGLQLESFAINRLRDTSSISIGEHAGLGTSIDTDALADLLNTKGIPTLRSDHAGSFYCNYIYYLSLDWCQQHGGTALFVHMPFTSELASGIALNEKKLHPSLPQSILEKGILDIISYLVEEPLA